MVSSEVWFSIIVPVYNVEAYVERCLRSLCTQTLDSGYYEVIVVDDGSPDHSAEIVERLAREYSVIRFIHQENKNQGGARNTGIRESKGRYLCFVDSDDYWRYTNVLEVLMNCIQSHSHDLIWSRQHHTVPSETLFHPLNFVDPISAVESDGYSILLSKNYSYAPWQFVIHREFLLRHNLFFREGVVYEDSDFTTHLLYRAEKVSIIDFSYYAYCVNPLSTTSKPRLKSFQDNCLSVAAVDSFVRESVAERPIQKAIRARVKKSLLSFFRISMNYSVSDSMKALRVIRNNSVWNLDLYELTYLERTQLWLMKVSPLLLCALGRVTYLFYRLIRR